VRLPLLILKDSSPCKAEGSRKFPAVLLVIQPQSDEMTTRTLAVLEGFAAMHDAHVVQEANISLHHDRANLVGAGDGVHGVESLGLAFGEAGDPGTAGIAGSRAREQAAGEVHEEPLVLVVEEGTLVVGGASTITVR